MLPTSGLELPTMPTRPSAGIWLRPQRLAQLAGGTARGLGLVALIALCACPLGTIGPRAAEPPEEPSAIPWGAMYVPLEEMSAHGMTGTFGYYRGATGVQRLLADLPLARRDKLKLLLTLGDVRPATYADEHGNLDLAKVHQELDPFLALAEQLAPFFADGTIWGIRFLDEPHDPGSLPRGVAVNPEHLGQVLALLKQTFGEVLVGSTAPARYMVNVPHADWCFGGYPLRDPDPLAVIREDAALAAQHGLHYVASVNACTNPANNRTFFESYLALASLPAVEFLTSWQWPQGRYPQPSFEKRLADATVQDLVQAIPRACQRPASPAPPPDP